MRSFTLLAALAILLAVPSDMRAGQVRVDIPGFAFTPRAVNCNQGDHVVWLNSSGLTHTIVSGDSSTGTPSGLFNSSTLIDDREFSWKTSLLGHVPYYSQPYVPSVAGRIIVATSGVAVADFRITEVEYGATGDLDRIEITNLGDATGDFGRYRLAVDSVGTIRIPHASIPVASLGRLTLHLNAAGTDGPADVYLPTLPPLPDSGSLALFVPSSGFLGPLVDATQLIDFVQWVSSGGDHEATAATAGFWSPGEALSNVGPGHSLEFCGGRGDYGASHWAEVASPNFGTDGMCATPTRTATWGRLKQLYR